MIKRGEQFVHRLWAKGIAYFGPIERNAYRTRVDTAVIGDIREGKARYALPVSGLKQWRNVGVTAGAM